MREKTNSLTKASALLAICIVAALLKNISPYITSPIVNACLIICALSAGLFYAIVLSIIIPIASLIIQILTVGGPLMAVKAVFVPCIILGNVAFVICVYVLSKKLKCKHSELIAMIIASVIKGFLIEGTMSLTPTIVSLLPKRISTLIPAFNTAFSFVQLTTALMGSIIAYIIWSRLKIAMKED